MKKYKIRRFSSKDQNGLGEIKNNVSEINKFKNDLTRISNSMGGDTQNKVV